jgi:hypothetical protein
VRVRAFRWIVATKPSQIAGELSLANTTPFARSAPNAAIQPANQTSSVHLTLHRLETVVEQMATRLARLEHSHGSLRRRIVAEKAAAS